MSGLWPRRSGQGCLWTALAQPPAMPSTERAHSTHAGPPLTPVHAQLPKLLKPGGCYSFFNGLAPDTLFFHMVGGVAGGGGVNVTVWTLCMWPAGGLSATPEDAGGWPVRSGLGASRRRAVWLVRR